MGKIQLQVLERQEKSEAKYFGPMKPTPCKWTVEPPRTPEQVKEDLEYAEKHSLPF